MKWSLNIGQYKGIPVKIHATFLLIIAWIVMLHWSKGHDLATTMQGIAFVMLLFVFVLLHEFGHALMARRRMRRGSHS